MGFGYLTVPGKRPQKVTLLHFVELGKVERVRYNFRLPLPYVY
jgi:hypothetical protein